MRCSQARQRLAANPDGIRTDGELRRHVSECASCASFAAAERNLQRTFELARTVEEPSTPLASVREKVEAHLAPFSSKQEKTFMSAIQKQFSRRPRLAVSVGLVAVLLLVMTLVPFRIDKTIGYEVAVAGVNKELAFDDSRINELLSAFDLQEARFEVGDCAATCKLVVDRIPSKEKAQLLAAALREMGGIEIEYVNSVDTTQAVTIFHEAANSLHFGKTHDIPENELHQFVKERIDSLHRVHDGQFNIFFTDKEGADGVMELLPGAGEMEFDVQTGADGNVSFELKDDDGNISKLSKEEFDQKFGQETDTENNVMFGEDPAAKGESDGVLPDDFSLSQNYPNPFNPTTTIEFALPQASHVRLEVYNINGRRVKTLLDGERGSGTHRVTWDATDDGGTKVASGVYLYRITAGNFVDSKKMSLVK